MKDFPYPKRNTFKKDVEVWRPGGCSLGRGSLKDN